jgi:hypothetical protein
MKVISSSSNKQDAVMATLARELALSPQVSSPAFSGSVQPSFGVGFAPQETLKSLGL